MRGIRLLLTAGLSIASATAAHAIVLGSNGTLALQLATLESAIVASGSPNVLIDGSGPPGHLTGLQVPAGAFVMPNYVVPVTDTRANPIHAVQVAGANGAGTFGGSGGAGFGGSMPFSGAAKLCLFNTCSNAAANLVVPLSVVGQGGVAFLSAGRVLNLTVIGAPWTTGTAAVGTVTAMGGVSPVSNTGNGDGRVQLVTPIFISTKELAYPILPGFGFLTLHFVPEPGTILLVGAGLVVLLTRGLSRARR